MDSDRQKLTYESFEIIKKLGDGNFTEVYKVEPKNYSGTYFALKVCSMQKVKAKRKETDILMEKHALTKIRETYFDENELNQTAMPAVRLVTTFRDDSNLFFLT